MWNTKLPNLTKQNCLTKVKRLGKASLPLSNTWGWSQEKALPTRNKRQKYCKREGVAKRQISTPCEEEILNRTIHDINMKLWKLLSKGHWKWHPFFDHGLDDISPSASMPILILTHGILHSSCSLCSFSDTCTYSTEGFHTCRLLSVNDHPEPFSWVASFLLAGPCSNVPSAMKVFLTLLSRINPSLSSLSLLSSQAKITQTSNSQFLTTKDFSCSYGCVSLAVDRVSVPLLRSVDMVHRLVHMTEEENS